MLKSSGFQASFRDIGFSCVRNVLRKLATSDDVDALTQKTIIYIENLDFNLLLPTFHYILDAFKNSTTDEQTKQKLIKCSDILIEHFLESPKFAPICFKVFNEMQQLPINYLQGLKKVNALSLLVFTLNSSVHDLSANYIEKTILPEMSAEEYQKIPEKVLFELSKMEFSSFPFNNILPKELPISLSVLSESPTVHTTLSLSIETPSLYDAVIELDAKKLISCDLFDRFFPDFSAVHAAAFLTALSSSSCRFRDYFGTLEDNQRDRVVSSIFDKFK